MVFLSRLKWRREQGLPSLPPLLKPLSERDNSMNNLDSTYLREVLDYNPETGIFTWKKSRYKNRIGTVAGCFSSEKYWRITIDKKEYLAHRLAWIYVHNEHPLHEIDHINGTKDDNRICNLRCATPQENQQNIKKANSKNTSGFAGVHWCKTYKKWVAAIRINKVKKQLGRFDSAQEAYKVYLQHKQIHHPFFIFFR
jgi:hypothetical protein